MARSAKLSTGPFGGLSCVRKVPEDEELQLLASDEETDAASGRAGASLAGLAAAPRVAVGVFGVVCLLGCVGLTAILGGTSSSAAAAPPPPAPAVAVEAGPLTVRSLLEGGELADITTLNIVAMHGGSVDQVGGTSGAGEIRARVGQKLQEIGQQIQEQLPEEHQKLGSLQVTLPQKEAAFRRLKHYGDPRLVSLARAVAGAVRENDEDKGDREALKRHVSEKLQDKLMEIQQLSEEMAPARTFEVDVENAPALAKADLSLTESSSSSSFSSIATSVRRLSADSDIDGGVRVHARVLLESMHEQLGEQMPTRPARMLSLFGDLNSSSGSSSSSSLSSSQGSGGDQSFMTCVSKAVPQPSEVCKCISDNMPQVMAMVMQFVKGKSP